MLQLPKLRFHHVFQLLPEGVVEDFYEFIGYLVDCEETEKGWSEYLYQDIRGFLHFCLVDRDGILNPEFKVGSWDVHVEIECEYWALGRSREEILAKMRKERPGDDDSYIPSVLRTPPQIETMHEASGYDS